MAGPQKGSKSQEIGKSAEERCEYLLLDNQLCFALYTASRLMTQAYQPLLEPLGLTYPQYIALLVLWEKDGITVSELGKRLSLDSGTLSPLLKKLEQRDLLTRERKAEDERSVVLRLTAQGRELKRRAKPVPEKMACLPGLQGGKLVKMKRDLEELAGNLRHQVAQATA
jgi:DNA-binding MarR family transcriptional regulator